MKVFIAGARSIKELDSYALGKMHSIYDKQHDVLVGDCYGVDEQVQKYYADLGYDRVTVFASNGIARNNIGDWNIRNVPVSNKLHGFEFYQQKDLAMSSEADFGLMIWDGESRGTLSNIIELVKNSKEVLVHLPKHSGTALVKTPEDIEMLVSKFGKKTQSTYALLKKNAVEQISLL